jgi:hypothetical protein
MFREEQQRTPGRTDEAVIEALIPPVEPAPTKLSDDGSHR